MANSAVVGILRALLTADTAQFDAAMKRSANSLRDWSKDLKTVGQQATQLGTSLTKTLTIPLVGLGAGAAKLAIDFESSFAGVRKTVQATEPEFQAMAKAFRELSKEIPVNVNELNKLGEAAGALGIPKEQIVDFTKTIALIGVTTNVAAEEAATNIAQIQNIFQAAGKDTDRFGAALVDLGNKGASTERGILELANRIASAGRAINLSQADVLGFASAIANVGIEAEAGGTAISKVFGDISIAVSEGGQDLETFAATARMSTEQFAALFRQDAAQAVTKFIEGIGQAKKEGQDLNIVLKELGFTEVRQARALRDLALSGDNLSKSLKTSNDAWRENTALTEEARKRFENTESRLVLLWNRIKDVGITLGSALKPAIDAAIKATDILIPIIDTAAKIFEAMPTPIKLSAVAIGAVAAAIGPLIFVAGQLAISMSALTGAFAANGLAARALAMVGIPSLNASLITLRATLLSIGAISIGAAIGAAIGFAREAANEAIRKAAEDLAKANDLIAQKEADLQRVTAKGNDLQAARLRQELELLKQGRDRAQQLLDQASAQSKLNEEEAKGFEFQGPMPSGAAAQRTLAAAVEQANAKIRKEIKDTGLTVGQLTKMLDENEQAFKAGAKSIGLNSEAVQFLEAQLQKQKKAASESAKATKELTKDVDDQRKELESLGLVTRDSVVKQFKDLNVLWSRAVAEGIPLEKIVAALGPAYQDLADKAKKSGVAFEALNEQVAHLKQLLPAPKLDSLTLVGGGAESILKIGVALKDITADSLGAMRQQVLTTNAFEFFGIKTQQELQRTAQIARDQFRALTESGLASAEQLKAAREKVLEFEKAAAGETISLWKTKIFPSVKGVIEQLTTAINGSFAQMMLGAKGFKEGFIDIWESIKASVLNILNSILSAFVNQFLKGITGALSGASGGLGKAFSGLLGGLGGAAAGGAVPGLAVSGINAGGGFAGGFGTLGGGISSAALVGITAGIGAAVVAAIALYNRQNNVTAKSREKFATGMGFENLGALYKQLGTMGPQGQQLANTGLNVIGRKDEAANRKWMEDVSKFMEAVKNFTTVVSSATGSIAAGFTGKISKLFQDQTQATLKSYDEQIEAARDNADEVKRLEAEKADFIKRTQADIVANTQAEFDRISRITLGSFVAAREQGQSSIQAIQTVGAAIDTLAASAEQFGFAGNAAFEELLKWRELTTINAPLLEQLDGVRSLLTILGDVGRLDQQMFSDLQAQGLDAYKSLIAAGFTEKQAREAVLPLIEEEIRLAKEKNLKIDEGTQALIDQMRANGELKTEQQSLIDVFKQGFGALLKFLKVDLPAGWAETKRAGEEAAEETRNAWTGWRIKIPVEYETPSGFPEPEPAEFTGAAEGGIVTSPRILGVGEAGAEAIIPLDKLSNMLSMPDTTPTVRIDNRLYIDGRELTTQVFPHFRRAANIHGVRPLPDGGR